MCRALKDMKEEIAKSGLNQENESNQKKVQK